LSSLSRLTTGGFRGNVAGYDHLRRGWSIQDP
jgi:hypothetical protein